MTERSMQRLNELPEQELLELLGDCCGSDAWRRNVAAQRPFADEAALLAAADAAWLDLDEQDWLESFDHHATVVPDTTDEAIRHATAVALRLYRERFGHPYVAATASSAVDELLMRVRIRLGNDEAAEWMTSCDEQRRAGVDRLRLLMHGGQRP